MLRITLSLVFISMMVTTKLVSRNIVVNKKSDLNSVSFASVVKNLLITLVLCKVALTFLTDFLTCSDHSSLEALIFKIQSSAC